MERITAGTQQERDLLRELAFEGFYIHKAVEHRQFFLHNTDNVTYCCYVGAATLAKCNGDTVEARRLIDSIPLYNRTDFEPYFLILGISLDLVIAVSNAHQRGATFPEISDALKPEASSPIEIEIRQTQPPTKAWTEADLPIEEFVPA